MKHKNKNRMRHDGLGKNSDKDREKDRNKDRNKDMD
jgi:hypothetical protein